LVFIYHLYESLTSDEYGYAQSLNATNCKDKVVNYASFINRQHLWSTLAFRSDSLCGVCDLSYNYNYLQLHLTAKTLPITWCSSCLKISKWILHPTVYFVHVLPFL